MNKRTIILSSVFMLLVTLLGIKVYVVLAETQKVKKNTSILQTTIEDRAIAIGTDGMVKVFETKVVSIYGAMIKTESMINDEPITFIISTDPNTKIYKNGTSTVELSTMQVDDLLAVAGNLDSLASEISITAQEIRIIDLSKGQMKKDAKVEDTATTSEPSKVESDVSNDEVIIKDQSSTTTVITKEETEATTTIEVQDDANVVPTDTDVQSTPETTVTDVPAITEPATEEVVTDEPATEETVSTGDTTVL